MFISQKCIGYRKVGFALRSVFVGEWINGETGYKLIDTAVDGEFILTYRQVRDLAETGVGAPVWAS